jgi:mannose-6-phosphate isomerase-like protein (cupin superfamily)
MKRVQKAWGQEAWIVNNELYCCKLITIYKTSDWSSNGRFHYHKNKDETFYIIDGHLHLEFYKKHVLIRKRILIEHAIIRLKPKTRHRFKAVTDECTFLEISTHHEDEDSYYI